MPAHLSVPALIVGPRGSAGPNGGIMTALNLFATRFDKVMDFVEQRATQGLEYFLIDTPGQMEIFTWSASGAIITETLATAFPTVIVYVMDTPRNQSSATFMSNMLYACSILYKSKLPMVIAFNKVRPAIAAEVWLRRPKQLCSDTIVGRACRWMWCRQTTLWTGCGTPMPSR